MQTIQFCFILTIIATLAGLIIDGLASGSVWIKGRRAGPISFRHLAHKCARIDEPWPYWFALGFYALALVCPGALLAPG